MTFCFVIVIRLLH